MSSESERQEVSDDETVRATSVSEKKGTMSDTSSSSSPYPVLTIPVPSAPSTSDDHGLRSPTTPSKEKDSFIAHSA